MDQKTLIKPAGKKGRYHTGAIDGTRISVIQAWARKKGMDLSMPLYGMNRDYLSLWNGIKGILE
ncbi:MAG: hypothetical protein HBSAPP01_04150 [Candidatus Brocadia sapporoensis]|nr:MAG: hypothetical protein HBSAPP01_04150 [Candidatus Brocadia sapporoensis]